jgi:phosphoglycerate dehydrogenase-like enzyme
MTETIEILITAPIGEELITQIQEISDEIVITHQATSRSEEISAESWEKTEILFTTRALPESEQAPNIRWVQLYAAGVDRILESSLLEAPNLKLTSLSGANTSQVAEHVLEMMLALGHRLPALIRHQINNEWPTDRQKRFFPLELRGATIGIVGYGSVGRQVARLLQGFGTIILASKLNLKELEDVGYTLEGLGDEKGELPARIYPAEALRSMFKECDYVVVATPLTKKTRGMISKQQLQALKPNAFLIDISRGGVIDQEALIESLQDKTFAGVALDVFPEEPLAADSPLWDMENVIITPHIAGLSSESAGRAVTLFCENLKRYLEEQPLLNEVDIKRGY